MIHAHCHCGNISVTTPAAIPETLTSCNCSICRRIGALWAYFEGTAIKYRFKQEPAKSYCWGDQFIEFQHCPVCGCVTHYTPTGKLEENRAAINFRMVNPEVTNTIKIRFFDGAVTWSYLDN